MTQRARSSSGVRTHRWTRWAAVSSGAVLVAGLGGWLTPSIAAPASHSNPGLSTSGRGSAALPDGWRKGQQTAEFSASDGAPMDMFGASVAISADGSTAVVGAQNHAGGEGAVYIYARHKKHWKLTTEMADPNGTASDYFGISVAIAADASSIIVGADGTNQNTGVAYIFTRHGKKWRQSGQISASDGATWSYFGEQVVLSLDGSTAVIGSYGAKNGQGSAYVFAHKGGKWKQTAKLTASDGAPVDQFGTTVAITDDGSTIVVGASSKPAGDAVGAAYVFARDGKKWTQSAELNDPDGTAGDEFGYSVAIAGDGSLVAVGAKGVSSAQGTAYLFAPQDGSWAQVSQVNASDGTAGDSFGASVRTTSNGSVLAVGATGHDGTIGAEYVFVKHGKKWKQVSELAPSDGASSDLFGLTAAMTPSGSTLVVGAMWGHAFNGVVYLFSH